MMISWGGAGRRHRKAGDSHRDRGEPGPAEAAYRKHLAKWPRDTAIWVQLGHLVKDARRFAEAEAAYTQAATIAPHDPEPVLHLAHLLKRQGRFEEARAAFKQLFLLAPEQSVLFELRYLADKLLRSPASEALPAGAIIVAIPDISTRESQAGGSHAVDGSALERAVVLADTFGADVCVLIAAADRSGATSHRYVDRDTLATLQPLLLRAAGNDMLLADIWAFLALVGRPVAIRGDHHIILLGDLRSLRTGLGTLRRVKSDRARLVLYVHDWPAGTDDGSQADGMRQGAPRMPYAAAFAEAAFIADDVVFATQTDLHRMRGQGDAQAAPPRETGHCVAGLSAVVAGLRSRARPASTRVIENVPGQIAALADVPASMPVQLRPGRCFRVSDVLVPGSLADYPSAPAALELAADFFEPDRAGARMRGYVARLCYRTGLTGRQKIVLFVALDAGSSATGRPVVMHCGPDRSGKPRAAVLVPDLNLLKIETQVDDAACFSLTIAIAPSPDVSPQSGAPDVALISIGYAAVEDHDARSDILEDFSVRRQAYAHA